MTNPRRGLQPAPAIGPAKGWNLPPNLWWCFLLAAALFFTFHGDVLHAATLPPGFSEIEIANTWEDFVGVTFDEIGTVYAWDRIGRIWIIDNDVKSPTPLLDISEEVGAWDDYGLLGVAFHPNFRQNGYIYLLYVVDHHYLAHFGTPSYDPAADEYHTATIGRITRYTARASDNFRSVDPASRLVLLGETASTGIPIMFYTHGVGTLVFGTDGSLLASCGDGAALSDSGSDPTSYYSQALAEGIIRPKENIGAFRSQMVDSLNGKILRLDPATGNGLPSNPFYDPPNPRSARSRVYALGLRNPYRICLRPDTGSHVQSDGFPGIIYAGDVGYFTWEELTVITAAGQNCGWPIFEGYTPPVSYVDRNPVNLDAPNPLFGVGGCTQQYFTFRDLLKEVSTGPPSWPNPCNAGQQIPSSIPRFVHRRPAADWQHGTGPSRVGIISGGTASTADIGDVGSGVAGPQFGGNCSIGGTWYTGTSFPPQYRNTYIQGDLGNGWIKCFSFDASNQLTSVQEFCNDAGAVVCLAMHPTNGTLYYIPWTGDIRKITYFGAGNQPPVAMASANVNYGPGPLTVQFTGTNSYDPDGQPLTYRWDFGDGSPISTQPNPVHIFNAPAGVPTRYVVTLTVSDGNTTATTVDAYANMEAAANGNLVNIVILNNGTKGNAGTWQTTPSSLTQMRVSTDVDPLFPGTVRCNGTNYTDAGSTRSLQIRNTVERQFCEYVLNDSTAKLSVGCFVRLGNFDATTFGYYDIFAMEADSTEFSVLSFVDGDHGVQLFQEHTSSGVGSMIPIEPNSTYWISMLWDRLAEQATLMVYDPATWSLLGTSSKDIPNTGPEDNARTIFLGRYDAHLSNGANSTNVIYYDDLLVDTTGAQFPLLPQTNAQIASTTLVISVNNTPPHVNITSPINGTLYSVATQTVVNLTATASDDEQSFGQLSPQWQVILHHNNHVHTSPIDTNWSTTATLAPLGCDGDSYFYRIQLTVSDPAGLFTTTFVDLFPNCVSNTPPTISDIPDQSILQNSNTGQLPVRVGDAETAAGNLSLSGFSSNTGLVPNANIVFGGSGSNRTVTVTPLTGQSGTATIVVLVSDGASSASDSFALIVAPPNNTAPTISNISDRTIPEDGNTGAIGFTVNDAQSAAASLGVSGSSSNPALVPNGNIVLGGSGSARTVTITPLPNQFGSTTITITVSDGLLSSTDTFVLTVTPVNDAPTISGILGQSIGPNSSTGPLAFTVSDLETPAGSLSLSGFSSNQGLIPNGNIVFGGSGPNRTVTVTSANGQTGSATITVTVSDGSLSNSSTFLVSVGTVTTPTYLLAESFEGPGYQDPDWIEHGTPDPDYASLPLEGTQSMRCVGEAYVEHPFDFGNSFYLYFQARWNNWDNFNNIVYWDDVNYDIVAAVYADENRAEVKHGSTGAFSTTPLTSGVTYHFWVEWTKGNGSDGTFKLFVSTTPSKPASPEVNITSGNGGLPERMYLGPTGSGPDVLFDRVLVDDVPIGSNPGGNQPPTISDLVNQTINEDGSLGPISFTVSDAESPASNLVVTGSSSDATLVPDANIVFTGSGANRLLTVRPAPNESGTVTITVTVSDGALTASEAFLLTVVAVNDAPTISALSDMTVNAGVSTGPRAVTLADVETPVNNLTLSGDSSNPTLVPTANIQFGGSGANRTVTVTPVAGQSGAATITVRVSDGVLTGSTTFVLTVNPPPPPTYLLVEGFEGRGLENAGWILHGSPDPDYQIAPLLGAQSLYMTGEDWLERAFSPGNQVSFYFQIRWNAWRDRRNILYWDDSHLNLVGELYAINHRLEISHGTSSCMGTNQIRLNTTYHVWVDWVRGTGSNGTMQLFLNTTSAKPARAEAALTTGTGGLPAHFYLGPMRRGPIVIMDRFLIDDAPIGSNP